MLHSVADIIELDINHDTSQEEDNMVANDTGGGTSGGATCGPQGTNQLRGMLPPAPIPPLNVPKVNAIQYPPLEAVARELGESLKERAKHLTSLSYHLNKLDNLIPKIIFQEQR